VKRLIVNIPPVCCGVICRIDVLDGSIDGVIKIPADQVVFLAEGFFLNRIIENKHARLIFYLKDIFLQLFSEM